MRTFYKKMIISIVLERAIVFEEEAYKFYDHAFSSVKDESSKKMLHTLRAAELRHRIKLESIQKRKEYDTMFKEKEIELPSTLDDVSEWPSITKVSSPQEILLVALRKEREAYDYYRAVYKHIHIQFLREAFSFLMNEELDHVKIVQEELHKR